MSAGYRERKVLGMMRPLGYEGMRSAGSRGLWDLLLYSVSLVPPSDVPPWYSGCLNCEVLFIQVKSTNDPLSKKERKRLERFTCALLEGGLAEKQVWMFPVRARGGKPMIEVIADEPKRIEK